ncbi:U4 U6.U5 tri-snRNP-associated protein [Coemansia asiatica]|uniref:U4 U6.U5 tri-snRNP-associated protein n=1 Tax=Coemansia asiatica TaxID=1052880 RepID=A0A9W7XEJ5_9FUNG|nr:U4 U6.U5 tri-snRNP-associated protein [Coemansia asiatica]
MPLPKRQLSEDIDLRTAPSLPAKIRRTNISTQTDNLDPVADNDSDDAFASDKDNASDNEEPKIEGMYLDTVNRANLDFDFEQICSVSLSNNNVYSCLVCGKYYQGRGKQTHAYFHSINEDHHVFINLQTLRVYVLPDNYEVRDRSLNDIKAVIRPEFSLAQVSSLDSSCEQSRDLNGKRYLPGFVGLNKIKNNDYINVVIQALTHVPPIRDTLLQLPNIDKQTLLVQRLASLVRRMWHPKLFKSHISPHELVQEVLTRSKRRFGLELSGDAFELLTWLLNTLHIDLGGSKKRNSSVVYRTFQGEIQIMSQPIEDTKLRKCEQDPIEMDAHKSSVKFFKTPFLTLSLDLPQRPLFTDDDDDENGKRSTIPQVALVSLLQRYNGSTIVEWRGEAKKYQLASLPKYIICHVKRFSKTEFAIEKNPTVVNFPTRNVSFGELLPKTSIASIPEQDSNATYNLISNICHDGQPEQQQKTSSSTDEGSSAESHYLIYVHHKANDKWYKIRDLQVEHIMPQMIFLSDTFIQIWERSNAATKQN